MIRKSFRALPFLALSLLVAAGPASAAEGSAQTFSFERVNGSYSNPNPELAPIRQGPLTVQMRSPSNQVEVRENRLLLRPNGDGTHSAWLTVELQGEGDLEADLLVAGMMSTMTDRVVLPPQTLLLEGRVRLERTEGGYQITGVEFQPEVRLEIQSELAAGLVATCSRVSILVPLAGGCQGLERSLATATVPMPEPGSQFLLSDELLTDADRQRLDAYLGAALAPVP